METHIYDDFYAFSASVTGIDAGMLLQNPRHRFWSISHLDLPKVQVQLGRLGSGNIVEGQSFPDGYLLYLPLTAECRYSSNGSTIERGSLMILEPGCEFCVATKDAHDWCAIFVPAEKMPESGSPGASSGTPDQATCRVSPVNHHLAARFGSLVRNLVISAGTHSRFEAMPAARDAAEEACRIASSILKEGMNDESNQGGRPAIPRQEVIRSCRVLLEERKGERIRVGDFARVAGVSERTLRTAFVDTFGVGPVRYLQLRQLHQVHRALRTADPAADSVTEVLFRQGVWELSRFARRYRQTFGELPSQTLQTTGMP